MVDTLNNTYKLKAKTFSSTTIFAATLPSKNTEQYKKLTLKVTLLTGETKQFILRENQILNLTNNTAKTTKQ